MIRWFAALLALAFYSTALHADELRPFTIEFAERSEGVWSLDWKQPVAGGSSVDFIVPTLPESCSIIGEPIAREAPAAIVGHADVNCAEDIAGQILSLPQLAGNADALLRVAPFGREVQTFRLTAREPNATVLAKPDRWQVFWTYLAIGTEHILMGWDHLLFVIALVLLVVKGWPVVKAATAFTVAHSITLVATTLGYTGLASRPVEALIALSIVFLAVEMARTGRDTWTRRWPWLVAFGFGLVHGFGFAGALRDIGLPEGEVPAALLAFNLGVEAGQLLVIAVVLALRWAINRFSPAAEGPAIRVTTYIIGIIASYWLIDRLVG